MNKRCIRKPKIYLYVAAPNIILWIVFEVFTILEARNDGLLIIIPIVFFTPFVLAFIYFSLLQINWKIEFDNGDFIYSNFFQKKTTYKIDDLVVVHKNPFRKGMPKFYIFYNGKRITTATMYDENIELLSKIKNQKIS